MCINSIKGVLRCIENVSTLYKSVLKCIECVFIECVFTLYILHIRHTDWLSMAGHSQTNGSGRHPRLHTHPQNIARIAIFVEKTSKIAHPPTMAIIAKNLKGSQNYVFLIPKYSILAPNPSSFSPSWHLTFFFFISIFQIKDFFHFSGMEIYHFSAKFVLV